MKHILCLLHAMNYVRCFRKLTRLILITTLGISSVIFSTFWRGELRHRNLPKVIQWCDFRAHVCNYYALLRCKNVETYW